MNYTDVRCETAGISLGLVVKHMKTLAVHCI